MDWNSTELNGPRVSLAIIKRPAKVPVTDPRYGGLLWFQTGGPGSSGVKFLLDHGKTVQMMIDSPKDPSDASYDRLAPPKYFDILGIDPRGVNNSTPRLTCFPNNMAKDAWVLEYAAEGVLGSSDQALANLWARSLALSEGCSRRIRESRNPEDKLAFYMNTAPLIADMVEVIEKHGKWREEEAARLLSSPKLTEDPQAAKSSSLFTSSKEEPRDIVERTQWNRGEEKLQYWGLSYATVVGATFATLQPHRIERVVLDGVAEASDYYSGEWRFNLLDTDILLDKLSHYCHEAGSEACALYRADGAPAIKHHFKDTVEGLKQHPVGVAAHGDVLTPDLITYSDVKNLIRTSVYAPIQFFPTLATLLSDLGHRNGTSFAHYKQSNFAFRIPSEKCQHAPPYSQECNTPDNKAGEISTAIFCTDGNSTYGMSKDAFADYAAELMKDSWMMGDGWAQIRLGCVAWGIKPKWRFGGPVGGITAKPMLLVGTLHDPVTPIRE